MVGFDITSSPQKTASPQANSQTPHRPEYDKDAASGFFYGNLTPI